MKIVSSHYLPCLQWFQVFLSQEDVVIDIYENYIKQSYRNRTTILSANGKLALAIPVKKLANHTPMIDVKIENDFKWQHQHWRSIKSAYGSSPYFLYYQDYFEPLYTKEYTHLVEWNVDMLTVCLKLMKVEKQLILTKNYQTSLSADLDFRNQMNPKIKSDFVGLPYLQVFTEKFPFESNLGILDVLFNHGPRWKEFI